MIAASSPRPAITRNAWRRGPARGALADVLLEVRLVGVQPHPADVDVPVAAGDGDHRPTSPGRRWAARGCGRAGCRCRRGAGPSARRSRPSPGPRPARCRRRRRRTRRRRSRRAPRRVWPKPTSCSEVSMKSGSSQPCSAQTRVITSCTSSLVLSSLVGLSTTASRLRGGAGVSSTARKLSRAGRLDASSASRARTAAATARPRTRTTATAMPTQVHHASDTVWKVQHRARH